MAGSNLGLYAPGSPARSKPNLDAVPQKNPHVYTKPNLDALLQRNPHVYTATDARRFLKVSQKLIHQDGQLPRVLVYAFGDVTKMTRQFVKDGAAPGVASWYSRNLCYTQSHGFDLEFISPRESSWWERSIPKKPSRYQEANGELLLRRDDYDFWAMIRGLQAYLNNGKYDYVFVMMDNMLINDAFYEFPVWAYDSGHDFTVMDQYKSTEGFSLNGILFRASDASRDFLKQLVLVKSSHEHNLVALQNGQSAFFETMLTWLGREAEADGEHGYHNKCFEDLYIGYKALYDQEYVAQLTRYSACFYSELERFAGAYGNRESKRIGFLKPFLFRDSKTLFFSDVPHEGSLQPLPNCFLNFRLSMHGAQHERSNCFAYFLDDPASAKLSEGAQPECPDKGNTLVNWYGSNDFLWFKNWSQRHHYESRRPRILIYTWSTENSFEIFANEAFWKSCYAHTHGYDVVFSDQLNVSGVKRKKGGGDGDFTDKWYSDEFMWAWNRDVQRYLYSGKYDYIWHVGADVLINRANLDMPLWAYDLGHDITFMDQDWWRCGYNQNGLLLKPTDFTREFLDLVFGYRVDFWLQGDNGPWMEGVLVYLGREAEAAGHRGYGNHCAKHGILDMPSGIMVKTNFEMAVDKNLKYARCFFKELNRLAGPFGSRDSKHLGWSKVRVPRSKAEMLPEHNDLLDLDQNVKPWANCFSHVRDRWDRFEQNCFAYHWNGAKTLTHIPGMRGEEAIMGVVGVCPDPSFSWERSEWNYANRKKQTL